MTHVALPHDLLDGTTASAEEVMDNLEALRDAINALQDLTSPLPAVRLIQPIASTIPNNVYTELQFTGGSEVSDPTAMHSETVNPGRITIARAGWYFVEAVVDWSISATGNRFIGIGLNGSGYLKQNYRPAHGTIADMQTVETVKRLAVGDYLTSIVYQDSGGSLDTIYASGTSPIFAAAWLGI